MAYRPGESRQDVARQHRSISQEEGDYICEMVLKMYTYLAYRTLQGELKYVGFKQEWEL